MSFMAFVSLLLSLCLFSFLALSNVSDSYPLERPEHLESAVLRQEPLEYSQPENYSLVALSRQAGPTGAYTLNIMITRSAARNIRRQQLNLGISKGFGASGEQSFNTVWMFEPYQSLQASLIEYSWVEEYRATFTTTTRTEQTIRTQMVINSPTFHMGQSVKFDGANWNSPISDRTAPNIGVTYGVDSNPMHPVLLAAYSSRGEKKWTPFFYGVSELSGSNLVGHPVIKLRVQLSAAVTADAFMGTIFGDFTELNYEGNLQQTVCVYTLPRQFTVRLKQGSC